MNIFLKTFFICFITLASSACHSYPIMLKILYHPLTKSLVGLVGEVHYAHLGQEGEKRELSFHEQMNLIHNLANKHAYTIFFEGNKHNRLGYKQLKNPTLGFGNFYIQEEKHPSAYKGIDPRSNIMITYLEIMLYKNAIATTAKAHFITYLQSVLAQAHLPSLQQEINDEINRLQNEPHAHSILNDYLYNPSKTKYIPADIVHKILMDAITTYTPINTQLLQHYSLKNFLGEISNILHNFTQQLKKPTSNHYQHITDNIIKKHLDIITLTQAVSQEWSSLTTLKHSFLQELIALGKQYHNSFDIFTNQATSLMLKNFFRHACLYTIFDILCARHILEEQKSILYTGANHCVATRNILCNAEQGFLQIYAVGSDNCSSELTPQDLEQFCTTLQNYTENPEIPQKIADTMIHTYQQQQQNLKKA